MAAAALCAAGPARAQDDPRLESTYRAGFSDALGRAHVVEVPLVPLEGAELLVAKPEHARRLGLMRAPQGRETQAYEDRVLRQLALRRATDQEVRDGKVKYIGLATRYHDYRKGKRTGSVQGDGKAAIIGDLVLRDPHNGRIEGIYEVQLKGVDTGLRPKRTSKKTQHGTGAERVDEALRQALMSEYLLENGVRATDWIAVIRTGKEVKYRPDGRFLTDSYQTGILVRAGSLLRIAHLQRFWSDDKLLAELVGHVNREASRAAGRSELMSLPQLYRHLTLQKADELARLYFARGVHGSLTLDNIGLFEHLDLGTTHTVTGRDARERQWRLSPGYAHEHEWVLPMYYDGALYDVLLRTAGSFKERKQLRAMRDRHLGARRYQSRLMVSALEHTGLDADDVAAAVRRRGPEGTRFRQAFERLALAEKRTGKTTARGLYDVFETLGGLVEISASSQPEAVKVARLVERMGATGDGREQAAVIARELLASFGPMLDERLRGLSPEARAAKVRLVADQAARITRPVSLIGQQHATTNEFLVRMGELVKSGQRPRLRAEWRAWVRENTRTGAQSPRQVAMRVRRGQAERAADRRLVLTTVEENGVEIQELSDGARDALRVTLAGNPLEIRRGGVSRMELRLNGGKRVVVTGRRNRHGKDVFEVPVDGPLTGIHLEFFDEASGRRWDNAGFGFGNGMEWSLGSPLVRAELAAHAERSGKARPGADRAELEALGSPLRPGSRRAPRSAGAPRPTERFPATQSPVEHRRQTLAHQPSSLKAALRRRFGRRAPAGGAR